MVAKGAVGRRYVNKRGFVVEEGGLVSWMLGEEPPGWGGTAGGLLVRADI